VSTQRLSLTRNGRIRYQLKTPYNDGTTRGLEAKAVNIACLGRNIRRPRVHVPLSLTATCQLCPVSRKSGRKNYIGSKGNEDCFVA